jgi:hypothetical protein
MANWQIVDTNSNPIATQVGPVPSRPASTTGLLFAKGNPLAGLRERWSTPSTTVTKVLELFARLADGSQYRGDHCQGAALER